VTYQGERGPVTPRLPDAGWLPDPSRTDLERYWDGRSWTSRTRDKVSKLERVAAPNYAPAPKPPRRRTRKWAKVTLAVLAVGAIYFGVASYEGQLPDWVPYRDVVTRDQPAPAEVAYPVFGSTDLVKYLAAAMVAQQSSIDISYWTRVEQLSAGDVNDAALEALTQNPYVFVNAWQYSEMGTIEPEYTYDASEAESRRFLTETAVAQAMADDDIAGAESDAERVTAIHDYIARTAAYDYASYEAINGGATPQTSPLVAQSQEAYGILVAHTAVCTGYAQAFLLLAEAAGLDAAVVTGTATGLTTGGHAWNMVLLDREWLVVDVTWDDNDETGVVGSNFLLIPTSDPVLASRSMDTGWIVDSMLGDYGI
jgi:hypothetical protein